MDEDFPERVKEIIQRHKPAMDKVIQSVKEMVDEDRETINRISNPTLRESLRKDYSEF